MQYNTDELYISKQCAFREDAIGGIPGMAAVVWSILNRAKAYKCSIWAAVTKPWAYSSICAPGLSAEPSKNRPVISTTEEMQRLYDKVNNMNSLMRSLSSYPREGHQQEWEAWDSAEKLCQQIFPEPPELIDPTKGATLYYANSMKIPPYWAKDIGKTVFTVEIGGQRFYKELEYENNIS